MVDSAIKRRDALTRGSHALTRSRDGPHDHSAEWKKPDTRSHNPKTPLIWNVPNGQIQGDRYQTGGRGLVTANGCGVSFWRDGNALGLGRGDGYVTS